MSVFSNVQAGWRNIHTDVEVAHKASRIARLRRA